MPNFPFFFYGLFFIALLAAAAILGIVQGLVEWTTVVAIIVGWFALGIVLDRWRMRVTRPMRATTARLTNGMIKTFYSASARAFVVSMADVIKARCSGGRIPNVTLRAYRSEGVEHLEVRWPTSESSSHTDTVLTFRVDKTFDDRWPDSTVDLPQLPVGDMVDAIVLANLINDAARGEALCDATPAHHDEAHESVA
ncbi:MULTISPECIES: hypothetical protein [Achromobacter]|uniref:hypothetical protein n=1 Tax=Achromobacter TaxID=222 RepID=UPI0023F735D6|nr:hypothetical protein [Achromobacter anxifer]MDF8363307.1 hypothetical protein [Achromobacter anxifer]